MKFILKHVKQDQYRFLSIYSPEGGNLLKKYGLPENYDESVVLVEDGKFYIKTHALLRITRKLNGLMPILYCLILIPEPIRDMFYRVIAKHRHKF